MSCVQKRLSIHLNHDIATGSYRKAYAFSPTCRLSTNDHYRLRYTENDATNDFVLMLHRALLTLTVSAPELRAAAVTQAQTGQRNLHLEARLGISSLGAMALTLLSKIHVLKYLQTMQYDTSFAYKPPG